MSVDAQPRQDISPNKALGEQQPKPRKFGEPLKEGALRLAVDIRALLKGEMPPNLTELFQTLARGGKLIPPGKIPGEVTGESLQGEKKSGRDAAQSAIEAKQQDPDLSKHLIALSPEEQVRHTAYLESLRNPLVVGPKAYGDSVVNHSHDDAQQEAHDHPHDHERAYDPEKAQEHAMVAYKKKIEAGLADPAMITTEMYSMLQVRGEVTDPPTAPEQVVPLVVQEINSFVEKGLITIEEAKVIQREAEKFSGVYAAGYPDASPAKVFEITRDMTRMIAYQTRMDKNVLVGSDHGERHILRGNMKFADQIIASLREQFGEDRVTRKEEAIVHAIIAMHDIGYTLGAAQVQEGFDASKDHPVAGAMFLEANKGWVVDMFGEDAFDTIRTSVLDHSYVGGGFDVQRPEGKTINPELIRAITSAVDVLGVTAETKIPAFFNNKAAVGELLKMNLAKHMIQRDSEGNPLPGEEQKYQQVVAARKDALRKIAASTEDPEQRRAFLQAVEAVNPRRGEVIGFLAATVDSVSLVKHPENGQTVLQANMSAVGEMEELNGELFADEDRLKALGKSMGDLGVSKQQRSALRDDLATARRKGEISVSYQSDKALVTVQVKEHIDQEFVEMRGAFDEASVVTQKWKIAELLKSINPDTMSSGDMLKLFGDLVLVAKEGDLLHGSLMRKDPITGDDTGFIAAINNPHLRKIALQSVQAILQEDINQYLLGE